MSKEQGAKRFPEISTITLSADHKLNYHNETFTLESLKLPCTKRTLQPYNHGNGNLSCSSADVKAYTGSLLAPVLSQPGLFLRPGPDNMGSGVSGELPFELEESSYLTSVTVQRLKQV